MRALGEEEVALARVDAGGHAQLRRRSLSIDSIVHCMSEAAPAARCGMALAAEEEEQRVAAELEDVAAVPLGDLDQARRRQPEIRWTSSSAPALPLADRRSASAVKPEMSTETSEPSSTR